MENFMTEEWIQQMQNHVDTLEKLTQKSKPSLVSEWLYVDWKQVLKKSINIKLLKGFPAHADSNAGAFCRPCHHRGSLRHRSGHQQCADSL